ncbi:hypothetical protein vseg_011471 [Gypsophila vaccaria]
MGRAGSPKTPGPHPANIDFVFGLRECQIKYVESVGNDAFVSGKGVSEKERSLSKNFSFGGLRSHSKHGVSKGVYGGKRQSWFCRNLRSVGFSVALLVLFFWLDSVLFADFDSVSFHRSTGLDTSTRKGDKVPADNGSSSAMMYSRLLNLASNSLAEKIFGRVPNNTWVDLSSRATTWKPCADRQISKTPGISRNSNGYILVSANGGLNQQRVAVCNAVAVASFLNATLVLPRFLYSSVWKDPSQFEDIYQVEHFINTLADEVTIVKELPSRFKSLDMEAIGSLITDAHLEKEAKPIDYANTVLPPLLRNGVVHLLGFGNRLGFDPLPPHIQRLRCKCNFHALKFVTKIQKVGSLLVRRIRKYDASRNMLDKELLGDFMPEEPLERHDVNKGVSKYLALHLRFEVDMVAYSFCEFGGGESERKELQAYRETHFSLLLQRLKNTKPFSAAELRISGRCPLTPEEAGLLLAGTGLRRETYIYLASSHLYGGQLRMKPFTSLYPNVVTKEDLLSPGELEPFRNYSSQLAALDFIACATADVFAMTDSGSQLSSQVSGFRTYFGGGYAPTLRPNKKRLSAILSENATIPWSRFQDRVNKMIKEGQRVHVRRYGQNIYRQPRSPECMCRSR